MKTARALGRAVGRVIPRVRPAKAAAPQQAATMEPALPSDVIATLGHELRTPLAALLGYAELLQADGDMDQAQRRAYASACYVAARHLDELVKAVVDEGARGLSSPGLDRQPVDLSTVLAECCELVRLDAERRGVMLHAPSGAPRIDAICNARAVRQIVLNLLGNAIKFTPPGGAIRAATTTEGELAVLTIVDTGVGMAGSSEAAGPHPGQGRGLGLSLVRSLARLHGGELAIRPVDPAGTLVRVTLPRQLSPDEAPMETLPETAAAAVSSSSNSYRMALSCA
ncbi:sensor histidine kinase [Chelatococcus reniformis]|uniref:histidine kinase n=1 Tax=Chelatococcus reniformis TaxID=1494448 RepID=A0A916XHI8_9HYPH|nr:HAMP domain-containing sensor histidine kinase [Chelatococcus reniformis]GGC73726.1 hypothetical protein GCM10010994_35130 [Chelatococcus reniformis]